MNKRIFLGIVFVSILIIAVLSISSCIDPKNNPMIPSYNNFPRVGGITMFPTMVSSSGTTTISVNAQDEDNEKLTVQFREGQNRGSFQIISSTMAIYTAPLDTGTLRIYAKVTDESGASAEGYKNLIVVNHPPEISSVTAVPATINYTNGNTSLITVVAIDSDIPNGVTTSCVVNSSGTGTGTLTLQSSNTNANTTTAVFLYTQTNAPGFYNAQIDISATDNLNQTDTQTLSIGSGIF